MQVEKKYFYYLHWSIKQDIKHEFFMFCSWKWHKSHFWLFLFSDPYSDSLLWIAEMQKMCVLWIFIHGRWSVINFHVQLYTFLRYYTISLVSFKVCDNIKLWNQKDPFTSSSFCIIHKRRVSLIFTIFNWFINNKFFIHTSF